MDVIIVSKTHMRNAVCVGGVLATGRFVRLLDAFGNNHDIVTEFSIGDVYTITYNERSNRRPPHIEDILISTQKFKFSFKPINKMVEYLTNKLNINICKGTIDALFEGYLQWTNSGSAYISARGGVPLNSTSFWMSDKDLIRRDYGEKIRYSYQSNIRHGKSDDILSFAVNSVNRYISFVGFQDPIDRIPAGTLLRVSLARWWAHEGEDKCFLQLSGWYI